MHISIFIRIAATLIVVTLFLTIGYTQTQKGQSIRLNAILEGLLWDDNFRMSGDGNTIVLQDLNITRTFIWKNNKWEEQAQIKNKRWDYFNISNDGLALAASFKPNLPDAPTKLFVYDFVDGVWFLRQGLDETLYDGVNLKTHQFGLSENGKRIFILNCGIDNSDECILKILHYQNNTWKVELDTSFDNLRFQYGYISYDGSTLLLREFYGNKIRIYKFLDNAWRTIYTNLDIGDLDYFSRAISLSAKGDELHCIKIIHDENDTAEKFIIRYKISDTNIEEIYRQRIDFNFDNFTRFSLDGTCLVTGTEPDIFQSNRVRLYKYSDNQYSEIETNLINLDTTLYFGVGRNISDDCSTLSIGVRPKEILSGLSEIRVYDISNLMTSVSDDYNSRIIKIFPNPTLGTLNIEGIKLPVELTIRNVNGQIILNQKLESKLLDIDKYPNGIYFISFKNNERFETFKIVKI